MGTESTETEVTEAEINARLATFEIQRNDALNKNVLYAGKLAEANKKIAELEAKIKELDKSDTPEE